MLAVMKDAEVKLVEMLTGISDNLFGWRGVHLHFHRLSPQYKSDYQSKITSNVVRDFVKDGEGGIYRIADDDIIIICKGVTKTTLDKMIFRLRYLFSDDPLAYGPNGEENDDFATIIDLTMGWDHMFEVAKKKLTQMSRQNDYRTMASLAAEVSDGTKPMTPFRLSSIEKDIATADLSRVMRRQPVCVVLPSKPLRPVFTECYINISHLRRLIMGNVDFLSNRWLFKYLTELLDTKMLDMLRRHRMEYFRSPVSLNLNVNTLLSEAFAAFDASLSPAVKVSVVIEIHISDVFSDMPTFLRAKESVQKRGYRVCLDGLSDLSFRQVHREALGFDLAKVQWNPKAPRDERSKHFQLMQRAVDRCGKNRVNLCWCDDQEAIEYGQSLGISLFQGRHLDHMLNPEAVVEN